MNFAFDRINRETADQAQDPFEYRNSVLVLKRGSIDPKIVETAIEHDRSVRGDRAFRES